MKAGIYRCRGSALLTLASLLSSWTSSSNAAASRSPTRGPLHRQLIWHKSPLDRFLMWIRLMIYISYCRASSRLRPVSSNKMNRASFECHQFTRIYLARPRVLFPSVVSMCKISAWIYWVGFAAAFDYVYPFGWLRWGWEIWLWGGERSKRMFNLDREERIFLERGIIWYRSWIARYMQTSASRHYKVNMRVKWGKKVRRRKGQHISNHERAKRIIDEILVDVYSYLSCRERPQSAWMQKKRHIRWWKIVFEDRNDGYASTSSGKFFPTVWGRNG